MQGQTYVQARSYSFGSQLGYIRVTGAVQDTAM